MQVNIFYWFLFFIFFVSFTLQVILLNSHLSKHEIVICDKKDPELRPYLLKTKRFFFFFSHGLTNLMAQHLFWINFDCRASFVRKLQYNLKFRLNSIAV